VIAVVLVLDRMQVFLIGTSISLHNLTLLCWN